MHDGSHPAPWPIRRLFPALGTIGLIVIGIAGTIWGPRYYGKTAWAVPDDLWATMVAAQRLLHLDLGGLYTAPTNLISFPGTAVILVPLAGVIDVAGLPLHAGRQGAHPGEWLLAGSYETAISAVALFAADAIAERLGASLPKRFWLAAAGATALWNVTVRWGHPEDAVAVGLLLYAVLALPQARPGRATAAPAAATAAPATAAPAAWLAGAAVAVQPLVLLAFPVLAAAVGRKRLPGFLARAAVPSVLLLGAAAAANWTATISRVTNQPNAPLVDHPTPWIYVAPKLSDGSVAAGPARSLAVVAALGCGLFLWRRWRSAPRIPLADMLWWVAVALALRSVFEPVMVAYYLWPPLAVALAAAARDWWRLLPAGAAAVVLTFLSQALWRNPWVWWTPMITVLALALAFARPRRARSPAVQVLPDPGEQFAAGSAP
jgi:hypothetical protein